MIFAKQDEFDKAALLVAEAIPVLKRLHMHEEHEVTRALAVITEAGEGSGANLEQFVYLRDTTKRLLERTPTLILDAKQGNKFLD